MKLINYILVAFVITVIFASCKKEDIAGENAGFIKVLESEFDIAVVGSIALENNSMLVVCRSLDETVPGYIYKVDSKGNLIWKKRMAGNNNGIWQVYDLPGDGFAIVGYDKLTDLHFEVSTYDDNGSYIMSKQIKFNYFWYDVSYHSPFQMLQLSNGNFVFSGSNGGTIMLYFTTSSFDTLHRAEVPMSWGSFVRGIYQNSDSTIAFSSSAAISAPPYTEYDWDAYIIQTDLNGNKLTETQLADSLHNETPNLLIPLGNELMMVTGRMGMLYDGTGTFVNYLNSGNGITCSGEINLVKLSRDGKYISRQSVRDYVENGMIMSAHPTFDGGLILCGTVNQADEPIFVSPTKIYLLKVSSSGKYEWSKTISTAFPSYGVEAIQSADGGYYVYGYEKAFNNKYNALMIRTDSEGNY